MNKLTAGVCCFALSAIFVWLAASTAQSAASARARATTMGAYLMMTNGNTDSSATVANVAIIAAVIVFIVGAACVISGLRTQRS
jgi:hypothetical protein